MEFITINILDKEYQLSCPSDLREELIKSAAYLNQKMLEIHSKGKIISFDGMLITAAINISYELIQKEQKNINDNKYLIDNLTLMTEKLNHALNKIST